MNPRILPVLVAAIAFFLSGVLAAQTMPELQQQPEATPEIAVETTPEATSGPVSEYPGADWVDVGRLRFLLPPDVATGATATEVEAVPLSPDSLFGDSLPAHTRIDFTGYMPDVEADERPEFFLEPVIYVFDTADFEEYESPDGYGYMSELGLLSGILDGTIRRSPDTVLPYLPVLNAAQIFRAREAFVEFEGGSGIAYLVTFGHDVSPILEGGVQFAFQGLTDDGSTYISAIFPIDANFFVDELDEDFHYDAFVETFEDYLRGSRAALEAQPAADFAPDLDALLALVGSLRLTE